MLKSSIWRSLFAVALGVVLVVWSDMAINYVVIITGVGLLLWGIASLLLYFKSKKDGNAVRNLPIGGIVGTVLGIALIVAPSVFVGVLMILMGVALILAGGDQLGNLITMRKNGYKIKGYLYIFPLLILAAGVIVVFNPFTTASAAVIFFGISLICFGLFEIIDILSIKN